MTAVSEGFADSESEVRGFSRGRMRGTSRGTSESDGISECFITTYQWMPSATYSLEEQLHRLAGELANLPRRACYVKVEDQRPFRTRTADLTPAFRCVRFKRLMLPVFLRAATLRSPFLLPVANAERAIAARAAEPDFAVPETVHLADDPEGFAQGFLKRNPDAAPKAPGRPFGVIKGGKRPGAKEPK
jgi:hypothetical protein